MRFEQLLENSEVIIDIKLGASSEEIQLVNRLLEAILKECNKRLESKP